MKIIVILFILPLVAADLEEFKACRIRDEVFPESLWNKKSGGECYSYGYDYWFKERLRLMNCTESQNGVIYEYMCGQYNGSTVFFDYTNQHYTKIIEESYLTRSYYKKWLDCATNAENCCRYEQDDKNIYPSDEFPCPATWDAWSCFPPAKPNTISHLPCPDYSITADAPPCILYSEKECYPNGQWEIQTDYNTCIPAPVYRRRHNFHVTTCYVSIGLSLPAVIIFMFYKNLRSLRVNLHRNLLIACILRNVFNILQKELVILDSLRPPSDSHYVLEENGVGCKILAVLNSISINALYACMLVDGFYLHKLIVRVFSPDPNAYMLYGVSLGLSIIPTLIWVIVLVSYKSYELCWTVETSWYQWIPDGFRIAILVINLLLLFDIGRVLCCKLRNNVTAPHTKSTVKAMVFLIPLFGVPFLFIASRDIIDRDSCKAGTIYYYCSYVIQALQGVMVAILFCYWNQEVHTQIKETIRKIKVRWQNRVGAQNFRRHTNRCETTATFIPTATAPKINPEHKKNDQDDINQLKEDVNLKGVNSSQVENQQNLSNRISKFIDE